MKTKISALQLYLMLFLSRVIVSITINVQTVGGSNLIESIFSSLGLFLYLTVFSLPLFVLHKSHPEASLLQIAENNCGRGVSVPMSAIYALYFIVMNIFSLSLFLTLLVNTTDPVASRFSIVFVVLGIALYGAIRGIETISRASVCIFTLFMLGMGIAIIVNYLGAGLQKKVVYSHAGPALMMCSTLMGAAVLMGILVKSVTVNDVTVPSVVTCMANLIRMILPDVLGLHLPLVIGILSVPLALAFDTDSYFYGMLPVMIGIGESFGIPAIPIAVAMVVCRNCATFVSPMVPATLLGVGLADVDIKDHIRSSFFWTWGFSILCMIFAIIIGIIPL